MHYFIGIFFVYFHPHYIQTELYDIILLLFNAGKWTKKKKKTRLNVSNNKDHKIKLYEYIQFDELAKNKK